MKLNTVNLQTKSATEIQSLDVSRADRAYHEMPGLRHETKDVLTQLNANIVLLDDLTSRLGFVMSEVRSLIRR